VSRTALVSVVAAIIFMIGPVVVRPAVGGPPLVGAAKAKGYPAKNCQYCHVSAVPKKDAFKPDDLNDRGKWLMAEKDKRKAKDIDVDWLKDDPGGKEQK
jgi:hypothetical protein